MIRMMGFEERPEQSGEIFGHEMTAGSAQIGYGLYPFNDPKINDEFYKDKIAVDAANYHIYAAEWTPTHVNFFLDNDKIRTIEQSSDYPMQFMLAVYEIPQHLTPETKTSPWPKTFDVDYIRGYRLL
jgi:beta-glucanase (GH16 family)